MTDSDLRRWSLTLTIDTMEKRLLECQNNIDEWYRKRAEYRIRLNQLRDELKNL